VNALNTIYKEWIAFVNEMFYKYSGVEEEEASIEGTANVIRQWDILVYFENGKGHQC
jgi:hypothetical protein